MAKRPTNTTRPANRSQSTRDPITLARAVAVCPNSQIAAKLERHFGLDPVDADAVFKAHQEALSRMADVFNGILGEKATAMHFQRIVGALVGSAFAAGSFYSQKVTEARDLTAKLQNDDRDADRDGVLIFENKAQRARHFAAQMGLQAYAQLAAAEGAVEAYAAITGETWKPYVAPTDLSQTVDRQAATVELAAFGE